MNNNQDGWTGFRIILGLGSFLLATASATHAAPDNSLRSVSQPGHVVMLRHANAPGVGDPAGFALGDCSTQRNLDEHGRAQAKALGKRLRMAGLSNASVYTSQWCRCRETAKLLNLGTVKELTALNSFFHQPENKESRLKALRVFIDELPRAGQTVVLVTHQMTITGLTGTYPASAEGLILKLRTGGGFESVSTIAGD